MSALTIAIISGVIAGGFYYINKETASTKGGEKKLRESSVMVFILSALTMFAVSFFTDGFSSSSSSSSSAASSGAKGSSGKRGGSMAVPYDYVMGGDPPF